MSRRSIVRWTVLLVVGAAAAWVVHRATRSDPVPVVAREVERGLVEATVANTRAGTVNACRRTRLSPQVGGRVAELPVRRGDRVGAGDLLLGLWNEDLAAQLQLTENDRRAAEARAQEACLGAELAAREAERQERLFAEGVAAEQLVDRARSDREARAAACQAVRAQVDLAASRVGLAREELAKTVLRAPFAGIVAEVNAELGEVVTPSPPGIPTPPAVDLIEEGCMYVVAPIDEIDAPRVRPGMEARVSFDAFPGQTFDGRVRRVAPYVLDREKQARTVDVEVDLVDPGSVPDLAPGYSADVEVLLERHPDVLRVPTESLFDGRKVLVLAAGRLEERTIKPGLANWQFTEILEGLSAGELVVTSAGRPGVQAGAAARREPSLGS